METTRLDKIELNVALVPAPALERALVAQSRVFAKQCPPIVELEDWQALRLTTAAHLTFMQLPVPPELLAECDERLRLLVADWRSFRLNATGCVHNAHENSLEVQYESDERLEAAQVATLRELNELRRGMLLDNDPAGNPVRSLLSAPGEFGENIRRYGYAEVGTLFRPHVTLNWFSMAVTFALDQRAVAPLQELSGVFNGLAVYALGPHGTCPQRLAYYPLV